MEWKAAPISALGTVFAQKVHASVTVALVAPAVHPSCAQLLFLVPSAVATVNASMAYANARQGMKDLSTVLRSLAIQRVYGVLATTVFVCVRRGSWGLIAASHAVPMIAVAMDPARLAPANVIRVGRDSRVPKLSAPIAAAAKVLARGGSATA